jgi:hypothetical protein
VKLPALHIILTDMQLRNVYDIPTNFHSRTRLPAYKKLPGGETTATMRFQCDSKAFKGNVQYPPAWMEWVIKVLNQGNKTAENYLFRKDGGIQNSDQKGRMEQLGCEGNLLEITAISGNKYFFRHSHTDEKPPTTRNVSDPRIHRITVVNLQDQLTRSKPFDVYFPLMARPGEQMWLDKMYLAPVEVSPPQPAVFATYKLTVDPDGIPNVK